MLLYTKDCNNFAPGDNAYIKYLHHKFIRLVFAIMNSVIVQCTFHHCQDLVPLIKSPGRASSACPTVLLFFFTESSDCR